MLYFVCNHLKQAFIGAGAACESMPKLVTRSSNQHAWLIRMYSHATHCKGMTESRQAEQALSVC